jgi:hypothetical protein
MMLRGRPLGTSFITALVAEAKVELAVLGVGGPTAPSVVDRMVAAVEMVFKGNFDAMRHGFLFL